MDLPGYTRLSGVPFFLSPCHYTEQFHDIQAEQNGARERERKDYTVNFDPNGGSCSKYSSSYIAGNAYGWLPTPTRFGYTFDGWFTSADGGNQITAESICSTNGSTLYAHWTRIILEQGSCGDNLTYILYGDGELDINGSGEMTSHPWTTNYAERIMNVEIGEGTTSICSEAFKNCTSLYSVNIPTSVVSIGTVAFYNCTSLSGVTLPDGLTTLGTWAFYNCDGLTEINIPSHITDVPDYYPDIVSFYNDYRCGEVFRGCDNLTTITIDEGTTTIPRILNYCTSVKEITIPDTVTSISEMAFRNCTALTTINIPDSVTYIGQASFMNCVSLENIELPANLNTLGAWAFYNCDSLTSINIPKGITSIPNLYMDKIYDYMTYWVEEDYGIFCQCDNLTQITWDDGITAIPRLFDYCSSLKKIDIPDSVTSIANYAFYKSGLTEVNFGNSVKSIGAFSFANCTGITTIHFPESVDTIGKKAFENCTSLENVNITKNINNGSVTYSYSSDDYSAMGIFNGCTNLKSIDFYDGIDTIHGGLFAGSGLKTIDLPDTVSSIGNYAFSSCSELSSIGNIDNILSLGTAAFANDTVLNGITLNDGIEEIPEGAFYNCSAIESINLPNSISDIGYSAFNNCDALKKICIQDSVNTIKNYAFYDCDSLVTFTTSNCTASIGRYALSECDSLTDVELSKSITTIGNYAFANDDSLISITIPDSVTSLGINAFYDCDTLTDVILGTGLTAIPTSCFEHCDVLAKIIVPYRVTTIGSKAFTDCVKFTEITIPRSVTSIDATAFSYPAQMTIYGVAGTYAETFANEQSITFIDQQVNATAVTLSESAVTLNKGSSMKLVLTIAPTDFTDEVVWKSSDTGIATIADDGTLKAVGNGTCTIKVTVGSVSTSCKVTVVQPVTSVSLNKTSLTLNGKDTYQLTASVSPKDANNSSIVWSTSDNSIASVDENGMVTANAKGTAQITASAVDGSGVTKTCTVTVANTVYDCTNAAEMESAHDYESNCTDSWVYTEEGVSNLMITFDSRTDIEDGFDYLYIYDGNGNEVGKYTGTSVAGKTIAVSGNTVRIKLVTDDSGSAWGFGITDIAVSNCTEHVIVIDPAVEPTETTTGLTEGSHCSVCGAVIVVQEVIPATGTTESDQPTDSTDVTVKFTDISASDWFAPYVQSAIDNGFMSGTSTTTFDPYGHTSRAMFVQILYAMAGKPDVTGLTCPFTDVAENQWYYKAVVWAYNNNVTGGTSATTFGPDEDVTREQVALLLYAYYGRPDVSGELEGFADTDQVSSWAYNALVWATQNGIMSGSKEGDFLYLQPQNGATRAVTATMMTGFYKLTHQ